MNPELNVLAMMKGEEIYIYVYDDESRDQLRDTFRQQAAEPALGLNWFDAAILTRRAEEQTAHVRH